MTAEEKRIAHLQLALMRSTDRADRHRLLNSLSRAEEEAYPAFINRTRSDENPEFGQLRFGMYNGALGLTTHSSNTYGKSAVLSGILVTRERASSSTSPAGRKLRRPLDSHLEGYRE